MVVDRFAAATAEFTKQVQSKTLSSSAAAKSASGTQSNVTTEDTTSFNSSTASVRGLARLASQVQPTRQAKIDALKETVKSAQYELDAAKIAQSIADSI